MDTLSNMGTDVLIEILAFKQHEYDLGEIKRIEEILKNRKCDLINVVNRRRKS